MTRNPPRWKIAVVGSGITGLGAALELSKWAHVELFEKEPRLGGHSHAVDVELDGIQYPVDTGFLVFNNRTYPNLLRLFTELNVPIAESDMSFAVSLGPYRYEWCGADDLTKAAAQPSNLLKPRFWRMIRDMMRFNRAATDLARLADRHSGQNAELDDQSLGQYLAQHNYSEAFCNDYLLPMAAAIWSCPIKQIMAYPMRTFVRFCDNHGLLQVQGRPKWKTVKGSSREYVERVKATLLTRGAKIHLGTPVRAVEGDNLQATLVSDDGQNHRFDGILLATHSPQSLQLLAQGDPLERSILGAIEYEPNKAYLHTDIRLMPKRRRAWAAWNYLGRGSDVHSEALSVTYWCNQLQPLPFKQNVFVTLNPIFAPATSKTLQVIDYEHPLFNQAAIEAQQQLPQIQGRRRLWFAGAWAGYGFHEDGLKSGLEAARDIQARLWADHKAIA